MQSGGSEDTNRRDSTRNVWCRLNGFGCTLATVASMPVKGALMSAERCLFEVAGLVLQAWRKRRKTASDSIEVCVRLQGA